ncbi:helix-turn-helix transcriptional regulator [Chitinophaga pinensis]|uniref:Transcriptional regulator, AraC family n=1 Tax=Chitinophaga pinensis (strain ATCC 43595 / DSM 2588 / LMG 13176 / NBRC 15968 / NCIMB 11800 / UQM 2034) TaxID=485918 RepID=A0A979G9I6_CHIPD|nr:helix-turn-helix transcriptional regulator [Chitinophaga pinensis]ACU63211.1 transcriptional regulator, AraC family [Chitinophaga pinensis DSM 2588]
MHIEQYKPVAVLQPFIRSIMIIESEYALQNEVLPDTSLVMAFRLKGNVAASDYGTLPSAVIAGLRKTSRTLLYAGNTANLLVVFREDGAAAFFKASLHELFGASAALDNFIDQQILRDISEQLAEASDYAAAVHKIQEFLLTLWKHAVPDLLVHTAIRQIRQANGNVRIKELLHHLYISQDAFEKRFRRITGATPKQFAAIVRLRSVIDRSNDATLTETAYNAGYFDQAHFIKDFKAFTGKTPGEFYRSQLFW